MVSGKYVFWAAIALIVLGCIMVSIPTLLPVGGGWMIAVGATLLLGLGIAWMIKHV